MRVLSRFLAAATDAAQFPAPSLPEVAFLGRSNVGKSSVINSLLGDKVARTSSTPGRTRSINFFEIRWPGKPRPELIFADLPGYGYAKISREISQEWPKFIEPYLNERPTLGLCIVLIDANVPPQQSDRQLLDFLQRLRPRLSPGRHQERPALQQSTANDSAHSGPGISRGAVASLLRQDRCRTRGAVETDPAGRTASGC
jgi:GTP-binding protein